MKSLLLWILGALSTVVGSWIASKIHVYHEERKLHRDDLKLKVLTPIHKMLQYQLKPLLTRHSPSLVEEWGEVMRRREPSVSESPEVRGSKVQVVDPWVELEQSLDAVLAEDAKQHHHQVLMEELEELQKAWRRHLWNCKKWVGDIAASILDGAGLPPHLSPDPAGYVMNIRLALFVYCRLFNFATDPLCKEFRGPNWSLRNNTGTVATGTEMQMSALLNFLDLTVSGEKDRAQAFIEELNILVGSLRNIIRKIELAKAERGLRGRCSMVTLF